MVVLEVQPDYENLAVNLLGSGSPWTLDIRVTLFLTAVVELGWISLVRRVLDIEVSGCSGPTEGACPRVQG